MKAPCKASAYSKPRNKLLLRHWRGQAVVYHLSNNLMLSANRFWDLEFRPSGQMYSLPSVDVCLEGDRPLNSDVKGSPLQVILDWYVSQVISNINCTPRKLTHLELFKNRTCCFFIDKPSAANYFSWSIIVMILVSYLVPFSSMRWWEIAYAEVSVKLHRGSEASERYGNVLYSWLLSAGKWPCADSCSY